MSHSGDTLMVVETTYYDLGSTLLKVEGRAGSEPAAEPRPQAEAS